MDGVCEAPDEHERAREEETCGELDTLVKRVALTTRDSYDTWREGGRGGGGGGGEDRTS